MYVTAPTTIAPDPTRKQYAENEEPAVAGIYAYLYAADLHEGLILIGAGTLLDGDPLNNFLKKDLCFNPNGVLNGARHIKFVGNYAYISCNKGIVVVDLTTPTSPKIVHEIGEGFLHHPTSMEVEFRYGFITDEHGLKVIDITNPAHPVPVSALPLGHMHNVYVARNYAYLAGGAKGLIIVNVTNPEKPVVDQIYNANGKISDLHDVKLGITYVSEFAYLADGHHGMHVVQLTSPEVPGNDGFSVRPQPKLIASFPIPHEGEALCIAEGVDRDRAVDESGNQLAVFGRVGAGPLNLQEQRRLYINPTQLSLFKVQDFHPQYFIDDKRVREKVLHNELEHYYGPSNAKR
jgi:hypothetical protein